jgi:hypothetical protein
MSDAQMEWLEELQKALMPPKKEQSPDEQREIAYAHLEQGGVMAKAAALHLEVGQEGYKVFQAKVHKAAQQVKDGDLSSIEQALVEQFYMLHSMAAHYGVAAAGLTGSRAKLAPAIVDMTVKCSKASRQLAQTIADLKSPRKTQFIKQNIEAQQNNLYALEQSNAQEMDPRATAGPARSDQELAAVEIEHRPQDGRGKKEGSPKRR